MIKDPSKLQNANTTKAIQINFDLIKEPLNTMGISYDPMQIQSRNQGAALKLLYAIKLKTEGAQSDIPQETKNEKIQKKMNKTQGKELANLQLTKKLEKFELAKTALYQKAADSIAMEKSLKAETIKKRIENANQTLRDNKTFMKQWMQEGLRNWYTNQQVKATRVAKRMKFEQTAVDKYKAEVQKKKEEGTKEVKEGIEGFERNLQRIGIDIQEQVIDDNDNENASDEKKKKKQPFSIVAAMTKIREKKTLADFARKEKDRRQRKTAVDQAKTQNEIERLYKETEMLTRLQKESAKNRSECYNLWQNEQCQNLIDDLAKQTELERQQRTKEQMERYIKEKERENEEFAKKRRQDLQVSRKKYTETEKQKKMRKRALFSKIIGQTIISPLLDIANEAYKKQLNSETKQINVKDWEQWIKAFIEGEDIVPGGVTAYVTQSKGGWGEASSTLESETGKHEIEDYVFNMGLWDPELVLKNAKDCEPEFEPDEILTKIISDPKELITEESDIWKFFEKMNNALKGTNSKEISDNTKTKEIKDILGYVPVKLAICGKRFTPKKLLAKSLESKFGFKILNPKAEIKSIKKLIENEQKAKEEKKEEKKEEAKKSVPAKGGKQEAKKEEPPAILPEYRKIVENIMKLSPEAESEIMKLEAEFVIQWLKINYPKTAEQYRAELKERLKRKKQIETELQNMQEEAQNKKGKSNPKKEAELQNELSELNKPAEKGLVLINFPRNSMQAQILQEYLVPTKLLNDGKILDSEENKNAKHLSGKIENPKEITWTSESSLDGFLLIDISKTECKKRGEARKKKPDSNEFWYPGLGIKENPEDKLIDFPLPKDISERLYWKNVANDKEIQKVQEFYNRFLPKSAAELKANIWNIINGQNPFDKISEEINIMIDNWINMHNLKETSLVSSLEAEILAEIPKTEDKKEEIKSTEKKTENMPIAKNQEIKKEEPELKKEEIKEISAFNREGIIEAWTKIKEKYVDSMNIIFKFYRKQKAMLISGLSEMHKQFIVFLERPDEKQKILDEFLVKLNALLTDHPDYIENQAALKEINQSVDELDFKLWKIVERKKDEAIAEREEKMASGNFSH